MANPALGFKRGLKKFLIVLHEGQTGLLIWLIANYSLVHYYHSLWNPKDPMKGTEQGFANLRIQGQRMTMNNGILI